MGHDFDDLEIDIIIQNKCKCCNCDKSIFELSDFPEVLEEEREVLCEECHSFEYRATCPSCENSYHKEEENSEHFFITKELSKETGLAIGLYKVLKYPFFWGNIVTGFESFFDDRIVKVSDFDIVKAKQIEDKNDDGVMYGGFICYDCFKKYTRGYNFIKALPYYLILMKKERHVQYKEYSDDRIHQTRQRMIHNRINFRGYLQKINSMPR